MREVEALTEGPVKKEAGSFYSKDEPNPHLRTTFSKVWVALGHAN